MPDRRDDEAVIAEALQQKRADILLLTRGMPDETVARYLTKVDAQIAALTSLSLRLQNAETALRFYADEGTWDDDGRAWHEPPNVPGMEQDEDRGRIARTALASSAEREPESETA